MLSALLCALTAASGAGLTATPRSIRLRPRALGDGFQPKDLNTVPHSTRAPAQLARPTDFSRQLLRAFSSPGFDGSNGAYCTSDNVSSRAGAATTRPDPLAVDLTNLTKPIPPRCFSSVRVSSANGLSTVPHTVPPLTECVLLLGGCWDPYPGGLTAPNRQIWHPFSNFLQLQGLHICNAENNMPPPTDQIDASTPGREDEHSQLHSIRPHPPTTACSNHGKSDFALRNATYATLVSSGHDVHTLLTAQTDFDRDIMLALLSDIYADEDAICGWLHGQDTPMPYRAAPCSGHSSIYSAASPVPRLPQCRSSPTVPLSHLSLWQRLSSMLSSPLQLYQSKSSLQPPRLWQLPPSQVASPQLPSMQLPPPQPSSLRLSAPQRSPLRVSSLQLSSPQLLSIRLSSLQRQLSFSVRMRAYCLQHSSLALRAVFIPAVAAASADTCAFTAADAHAVVTAVHTACAARCACWPCCPHPCFGREGVPSWINCNASPDQHCSRRLSPPLARLLWRCGCRMSTAPTFTNLVAAFSPPYCGAALSAVSVVIARCTPSAVAAFLCQSHSSLDDAIVSLISCVASVATDSAFTYLFAATGDRYIFDSVAPMVR